MSSYAHDDPAVDQVRVSVLVAVPPDEAFRIFTEEIDLWWRRGLRYRVAAGRSGTIHLEPGVGGRLYESSADGGDTALKETGRVTAWDPPRGFCFTWRAVNFAPGESTSVEVAFEASRTGTRVTVTHRGWNGIRGDHPVRHGMEAEGFLRMMGGWWGALMEGFREWGGSRGER
ncbi:MAG TPA: SRPBCC domain-containing protein [Polyangiaceae bacterium]|nr:SRPBCC domain-containing protein [Polyangiaceae bacterium]